MKNVIQLNSAQALQTALDYYVKKNYEGAEQLLKATIKGDYLNGHAHNVLGLCYAENKRYNEALVEFDLAGQMFRDELISVSCNRGMALGEMGRSSEAILMFDNILKTNPNHTMSYLNRGILYMQTKRFSESLSDFSEVIKRDPKNIEATYARGFANLVLGNYREGFRDFEYRLREEIEPISAPQWTGVENLTGKTILVHGEQGHGDTLQFFRYVSRLVALKAWVVIVVHKPIEAVVTGQGVEVLPMDRTTWPKLDYWVPIMSLAYIFGTSLETVPAPWDVKYDPLKLEWWSQKIPQRGNLRVGLCWSGNRISKYDKNRSVPLVDLEVLINTPHVDFYSFQKDVRETDLPTFDVVRRDGRLFDLEAYLTDFNETAHAMKQLDLMVTCDTSVAHMAGTVGVPTWIMLTDFRTYWLWTHERQNCPWYPSVRIFRQAKDGEWAPVVSRVRNEMVKMISQAA